jgi:hypothetical protein
LHNLIVVSLKTLVCHTDERRTIREEL